jgi:hypothetical protein
MCGVDCEAGHVRWMRRHVRVCLGTFEPFLARCAAVRRLRVIEGMMLRGYRNRQRQEYAGTNEGRDRGTF